MPLILAIEPDRRQGAQLSAVVRKRVSAELILVDTTEQALDAIGDRMPDLLLVPALLSPQDDAALAGALRVIAAAAHVQMLTIPVLGAARPAPRSGGMLAALRRGKSPVVQPDGCDPSVFAEQIASYLERAAQERAGSDVGIIPDDSASWPEAAVHTEAAEAAAVAEFVESPDEIEEIGEIDGIGEFEAIHDAVVEPISAAPAEATEPSMTGPTDESVSIALEQAVWALFADEAPVELRTEPPFEPPVPVAAAIVTNQWGSPSGDPTGDETSVTDWPAVEELMAALEAMPLSAIEVSEDDERTAPNVEGLETIVDQPDWVIEDPNGDEIDLTTELKDADGQAAPVAVPAGSEREWVALIESLRHDVERLRAERAEKPVQKTTQPPAVRPGRKAKPVQDEWGFFDPEQCGFAALLAKLDEVTDADEGRI